MNEKVDVLVIGGGLAGTTAAKSALDQGARVMLLNKSQGATALSSGSIDILGNIPDENGSIVIDDYSEGIEELMKRFKDHPYGFIKDDMEEALLTFFNLCQKGDISFYSDNVKNSVIPNILGTFKNTAYVPYTYKDMDMKNFKGNVLVVGIKGYTDFYAEVAAQSYNAYIKEFAPSSGANFLSTIVQIKEFEGRSKVSDGELSAYMDSEEGINTFISKLQETIEPFHDIELIIVPPILGYMNYKENKNKLEEELNIKVGEVMSAGHFVAGQRLISAMGKGLLKEGVIVKNGHEVINIEEKGDSFEVISQTLRGEEKIIAHNIVLATGDTIGGGIKVDQQKLLVELLDYTIGNVEEKDIDMRVFNSRGQGFVKLGVEVSPDLKILKGKFPSKIYGCGALIEGYDWVYERSGGGMAIGTGYIAGKNAALNKGGIS